MSLSSMPTTFAWNRPPKDIHIDQKEGALLLQVPLSDPKVVWKHVLALFGFGVVIAFCCLLLLTIKGDDVLIISMFFGFLLLVVLFFWFRSVGYLCGSSVLTINNQQKILTISSGWLFFRNEQSIALKNIAVVQERENRDNASNGGLKLFSYTHYLLLTHVDKRVKALKFATSWRPSNRQFMKAALENILADFKAGKPYFGSVKLPIDLSEHLIK